MKYYSLAGLSTYSDSNWNEEELVRLFNNELCNDWGNLVTRTLHLVDTKSIGSNLVTNDFIDNVDKLVSEVNNLWSQFKVREALQKTNDIVKIGNKYINDEKPWVNVNYNIILSNLYYLIKEVNKLYYPVFPDKCDETSNAILNKKKVILFSKIV